jgi:hypothetical protein
MTDTEFDLYDEDDILIDDDSDEWQVGDCDHCAGHVPDPDDPPMTPACACAIGQGAAAEDCHCGPLAGPESEAS